MDYFVQEWDPLMCCGFWLGAHWDSVIPHSGFFFTFPIISKCLAVWDLIE